MTQRLPKQSIAFANANDVLSTNADGTLPMHPNSDLFYLSGIEQEETILLLFPDASNPKHREILFLRQPNENLKIWEGRKHNKEKAREISGIQTILWKEDFDQMIQLLAMEAEILFLNDNEHSRAEKIPGTRERRFNEKIKEAFPLHQINRLAPHLHDLRFVKNPQEIELIKHAIKVTGEGFIEVMKKIKPGIYEYEIEGEWARSFISRRCKFAYPPIIASGQNSCVLHYLQNDQNCKKGDLLLMDVGACYANYNADLTRTIPISGKFSRRQKQVYKSVLRVLRKSIANAKIGKTLKEWQSESHEMMNKEMLKLKIISSDEIENQNPGNPACKRYFMHGLGHSLGLDVHDVSNRQLEFQENSVFTVEPGIYLPNEGFGIRLEENILLTRNGSINLTANIPIEPEDIEDLMKT